VGTKPSRHLTRKYFVTFLAIRKMISFHNQVEIFRNPATISNGLKPNTSLGVISRIPNRFFNTAVILSLCIGKVVLISDKISILKP
jgi:hypothetical protein